MSTDDKEGYYCSVCGGISPGKVTTKRIPINGIEVGIDKLDQIIAEVKTLNLLDDHAITEELLRRTKRYNYIPSKKTKEYGAALLKAYKGGE